MPRRQHARCVPLATLGLGVASTPSWTVRPAIAVAKTEWGNGGLGRPHVSPFAMFPYWLPILREAQEGGSRATTNTLPHRTNVSRHLPKVPDSSYNCAEDSPSGTGKGT